MKKIFKIILLCNLLFPHKNSFSQTQQDCLGAIPITNDTIIQSFPSPGEGGIQNEINGSLSCLFSGEKNSSWFSYCVKNSGSLCFSVIPDTLNKDFDWAVFNLSNAFCSQIYFDSSLEISCNFSNVPGITGLNGLSGSQNEPCLQVNAGENMLFALINM